MSAILSPLFKVADYGIEEYNLYPIRVNYQQLNPNKMEIENEKSEMKSSTLFSEGCNLPSIKSISFTKADPIQLSLMYESQKENENYILANYTLVPGEIKEKEFKQEVRIKLGINGIVEITEYSLKETYYEEVLSEKKVEKRGKVYLYGIYIVEREMRKLKTTKLEKEKRNGLPQGWASVLSVLFRSL